MHDPRRVLLLSTSTVHGSGFLEYCLPVIANHFAGRDRILFVPYASPGGLPHDEYTELVSRALDPVEIGVEGIHASSDPARAMREAQGIFIGGGNTFLLLRELYERELLDPIRDRVEAGAPYMGSSAGSNVAGATIGTTNDMPIVHPPAFEALGLVPFNINPHYLDPDPGSKHMGETRETRIREFHVQNPQPVVGLREGAWLARAGDRLTLEGSRGGRLFRPDQEAEELLPGSDLSYLL
ncbi:MAG: dipeptidase PepE [marine benthic group bacterium]|nr:dipeptidase PepE [Gemmatimonadota bacterium]MCL7985811.1 dipeptidase PepE [Gemmatimonadota bacterium]